MCVVMNLNYKVSIGIFKMYFLSEFDVRVWSSFLVIVMKPVMYWSYSDSHIVLKLYCTTNCCSKSCIIFEDVLVLCRAYRISGFFTNCRLCRCR